MINAVRSLSDSFLSLYCTLDMIIIIRFRQLDWTWTCVSLKLKFFTCHTYSPVKLLSTHQFPMMLRSLGFLSFFTLLWGHQATKSWWTNFFAAGTPVHLFNISLFPVSQIPKSL